MKNVITSVAAAVALSVALAHAPSAQAKIQMKSPTVDVEQYLVDKPEKLRTWYRALYNEGTRNATLNALRLGLAAIELGEYAHAERAFDTALEQIESVYANDERAKQARSKWSRESVKDFKGEPYERAMAYYYRGVLYMRAGDYENARASFLQAQYQSTISEGEEYKSHFPMMEYLAGWASQCAGQPDKAQGYFAAATAGSPTLKAPAVNDTVLMIAELGTAPVKFNEGKDRELLQFKAGISQSTPVSFTLDAGHTVPGFEAGSVSWQAMNRGGRPIQGVLNGKARFKDGMDAFGNAVTAVGMGAMYGGLLSNNSDAMNMGAAAGAVGLLFNAFAAAAKPEADARAWENLPDSVHLATMPLPAGAWQVGASIGTQGVSPVRLDAGTQHCAVIWSRSHSAAQIAESAPGTGLSAGELKKLQRKFADRDAGFRAQLLANAQ